MRWPLLFLLLISGTVRAQCDPNRRPVIFIHGFLASGDTWSNAVQQFQRSGYCADQLIAFDWNSVGGNAKKTDSLLSDLIDRVLARSGAAQVDLVGHSAGGGVARTYLRDSSRAKQVAHYVHIGSRKWTSAYEWFPNAKCLNIFSSGDRIASSSAGPIEGAVNLSLQNEDHYQVATAPAPIDAMLKFFNSAIDTEKRIVKTNTVQLSGKAVTLGDNQAMGNAAISIYRIRTKDGARQSSPIRLQADASGNWGPVELKSNTAYEFELIPATEKPRIISYFFSGFSFSDPLVYLRGFPQGKQVMALLGQVPEREDQSALVIYSAASAMIGGRDSVTVNGISVCSATLTPASKTAITSFIYEDGDGVSTGRTIKQFTATPFISGIDLLLEAGENKLLRLRYNSQQLTLRARPSKERVLLAVFR
jgi:pimeloyl-ACP methyl ester carboxylesterase